MRDELYNEADTDEEYVYPQSSEDDNYEPIKLKSKRIKKPPKEKTNRVTCRGQHIKKFQEKCQEQKVLVDGKLYQKVMADGKRPFTHFISLPVISDTVKSVFLNWRDNILAHPKFVANPTIIEMLWAKPEMLHYTLLMLPLCNEYGKVDENKVEKCKQMMKELEPEITQMIKQRCGKLILTFDKVDFFGNSPDKTRVIFMKLSPKPSDQYDLLNDIVHLIITASLAADLVYKKELSYIKLDKVDKKYKAK